MADRKFFRKHLMMMSEDAVVVVEVSRHLVGLKKHRENTVSVIIVIIIIIIVIIVSSAAVHQLVSKEVHDTNTDLVAEEKTHELERLGHLGKTNNNNTLQKRLLQKWI